MKKLFILLPLAMILCFMVGCQDKAAMAELEEFRAQAQVEEQNKKLIIRLIEEMDKGNFDIFDELSSDDYVCHFSWIPEPLNREARKQFMKATMVSFPDFNHTIEDVIAQGDKVVLRLTNRGTHEGAFRGIPPTGKEIEYTAIFIGQFVDGKVVETWVEANILGLNMQLGMELKPKEGEK
jgi:steroid delta-isomerase-like uncharacterized protein